MGSCDVLYNNQLYIYISQYSPKEMIVPVNKGLIKPAKAATQSLDRLVTNAFTTSFTRVFDNKKEFLEKGIKQIQDFYVLRERFVSLKILQKYSDELILQWVQKCILKSNITFADLPDQVQNEQDSHIFDLLVAGFLKVQLQHRQAEASFQGLGKVRQINATVLQIDCGGEERSNFHLLIRSLNFFPTISRVVILNGRLTDLECAGLMNLSKQGKKIRGEFTYFKKDNIGNKLILVGAVSFISSMVLMMSIVGVISCFFPFSPVLAISLSFLSVAGCPSILSLLCAISTYLRKSHWTLEHGVCRKSIV